MKYIEPNLPDHVFEPQILQPLCLVCRKFEDSGGHIMNDQKVPAEIEAALDRYADFATDTNRNRVMDSINDLLRAQLAAEVEETAAWRKTATFRAEILSTAEADLKTRTKELDEAQAKNTEDKETLMWAIRAKDKQLQQWQDDYQELAEKQSTLEAEAVELRKDKARLDFLGNLKCGQCTYWSTDATHLWLEIENKSWAVESLSLRDAIDEAIAEAKR